MDSVRVKLHEDGTITLPAEYREALGLVAGEVLILSRDGDELRIYSLNKAIERAQAIVRQYVPEGRLASEELIAQRRAEAARE